MRLAFVDLKPLKQGALPQVSAKPSHSNNRAILNPGDTLKKMLLHWARAGFAGVKDAVDNRREMTPEERAFYQNVKMLINGANRGHTAAISAWDRMCATVGAKYDLTPGGGRSYMHRRKDLLKWSADQMSAQHTEIAQILAKRGGAGVETGLNDPSLGVLEGGD